MLDIVSVELAGTQHLSTSMLGHTPPIKETENKLNKMQEQKGKRVKKKTRQIAILEVRINYYQLANKLTKPCMP